MGYYTMYGISTTPSSDEVVESVRAISGYSNPFDGDSVKWYEHENDCKAASKLHPDVIIELSGEGEESGDIWKKYFLNGKMQVCKAKIVFPEYDVNELK